MAITTIDGKFALLCYNQPGQVVLTQPTSPFDQGEKQGLMWQFPEILWGAPVAPTGFIAPLFNMPQGGSP